MMKIITLILLLLLLYSIKGISSIKVELTAPTSVYPGQPIYLNCTSDTVPDASTAEFLVNGISFNNVQFHGGSCFKTLNDEDCFKQECICSSDKKSYVLAYTEEVTGSKISFTCIMKFSMLDETRRGRFFEDTTEVAIREVQPPTLLYDPISIFDNNVKMTCMMETWQEVTLALEWRCNETAVNSIIIENNNSLESYATKQFHQKETCTCTVFWSDKKYNVSSSVVIPAKIPMVHLTKMDSCVLGTPITLHCSFDQRFQLSYGMWIHSFDEQILRTAPGIHGNNSLSLIFDPCENADMGNYMCSLELVDTNYNKSITINNSLCLEVEGPPWIERMDVNIMKNMTVLSVQLYSYEPLKSFKWFKSSKYIATSTNTLQICDNGKIWTRLNGTNVKVGGFLCNITVDEITITDVKNFDFCVENSKGEICRAFHTDEGLPNGSFQNKDIVTFIIGFALVIAVLVLSSGLVAHKFSCSKIEPKESVRVISSSTEREVYRPQTSRVNSLPVDVMNENMYLTPEADTTYEEIIEVDNTGYLFPIVNHYDIVDENAML